MKNFSLKKYLGYLLKLLGPFKRFLKIDPYSNWIVLVSLFVLVNLIFVFSSFRVFSNINSDEFFPTGNRNDTPLRTLDRGTLEDTLNRFEIVEENFKDLKESRPSFVDPSL